MADKIPVITLQDWQIQNPRSDHPGDLASPKCSEAHVRRTQISVERLPDAIQSLLRKNKFQVLAIREVTDFKPEWKTKQAEGYSVGATFAHVGGATLKNERLIILAEFEKRGEEHYRINYLDRFNYIFNHEIGHAIDFCLGISDLEELQIAWVLDVCTLPNGVDQLLSYFIQETIEGPRETVAEIFSAQGSLALSAQQFECFFRRTSTFVRERLRTEGIPIPAPKDLNFIEEYASASTVLWYQIMGELFGGRKGKRGLD